MSMPCLCWVCFSCAVQRSGLLIRKSSFKRPEADARTVTPQSYQRSGVVYLPDSARFSHLLNLPEGENIGKVINDAMGAIEETNLELKGVLPRTYQRIPNSVLVEMLKLLSPLEIEGDAFGQIYEYFMGNFAIKTMQKGGEFYTPSSLVRLIVAIIEPFHGRIFDPACGSGRMFVHSGNFVRNHQKNPSQEITIFGVEKVAETLRMAKLNLAMHGLSGDIREANTYYEDPHGGSRSLRRAIGPEHFVCVVGSGGAASISIRRYLQAQPLKPPSKSK
jgi:type I restriction enzyme M protein